MSLKSGFVFLALALVAGSTLTSCKNTLFGSETPKSLSPTASAEATEIVPLMPSFSRRGWKTDFTKYSVPLNEISSGGPERDGIPPIDQPKLLAVADAKDWLKDNEPVISFELGGEARAYPLQILIWHEIVNDVVGGTPVLITFCPLCNTAIAFERTLGGKVYDFGTTGNLRHSDLVMWDRQTESWWQQITGEAIVGELTGSRLIFLTAAITSWKEFKTTFPQGLVLSRDTGHTRPYGINPYVGYDSVFQSPFLFRGPSDPRLPPMERVATVSIDGTDVAYPFSLLTKKTVINDRVGETPLVVFYVRGTASALDTEEIARSQDIGATGVFSPIADGRKLTFRAEEGRIIDKETGSEWSVLGRAVKGPLMGKKLEPILHGNHFWFAWAIFKPNTIVYRD
ncbi:MAG: DUF3179 domain-containing protein [Chloroflexi bacterium]|nr:DUF3179 domain-containing protein [Chloroflexota bacterium]